jgi:hypothetical protein
MKRGVREVGPRGVKSRVIWVGYVQPPVHSTTSEAVGVWGPTAAQPVHKLSEQGATELRHVKSKKNARGSKKTHEGAKKRNEQQK